MEKIRVLIVSVMYPNTIFNCGIAVHNQVNSFLEAGCRVKVIFPVPYIPKILRIKSKWKSYGQIPEKATIDAIPIYYPRYIRFPGKWFHASSCYTMYWGSKKIVHSIIREFKPHILHAFAATPSGYVGLLLKKKYKIPLICSLRGGDINGHPNYGKVSMALTRKLISEADQLLSVSNVLKNVANSIGKPKKEIRVVYQGCDIETFTHSEVYCKMVRGKLNILKREKVIIFVGNILEEKGVFELTTAFIRLNSKYPDLHLIIVGNGPGRLTLENIVFSNNLDERVHLVGEQPHGKISEFLSAADIFVLPSHSEGLPNVILEAMASSLPVIATRVGGIPEAVEDGKSGILIDKKDIEGLTKAIEYLVLEGELAKKMGLYGRKIVENKFSWTKSAEKVIKIYEDVIYATS